MVLHAGDEPQKGSGVVGSKVDGFETAKTIEKLKSALPFAEWKAFDWKGKKLLVGLSTLPTDSSSHIDVHGYIYNRYFKEWRRFCLVKTRHVGSGEVGLDEKNEELYLLAKANTPMKGKRVFRYSLLLFSDDRGYLPKAAEGGADPPAAAPESKAEGKEKIAPESNGRPQ